MKSAVKLLLILIYLTTIKILLCLVDIQESSCEDNAKFNFLGVILESKKILETVFSGF